MNQSPDGKPMPCCRNCKITTGQDFTEKDTAASRESGKDKDKKLVWDDNTGANDVSQAE